MFTKCLFYTYKLQTPSIYDNVQNEWTPTAITYLLFMYASVLHVCMCTYDNLRFRSLYFVIYVTFVTSKY